MNTQVLRHAEWDEFIRANVEKSIYYFESLDEVLRCLLS